MITVIQFLLLFLPPLQEKPPFKASSEFEVVIDYKFEARPALDHTKVEYDVATHDKNRKAVAGPLPYLTLHVKFFKLHEQESRIRVTNSADDLLFNRKATEDTSLKFKVGFIDDVKDRVVPHEFTINFLSDSKEVVSRIHLTILEDGTFLVNDEKKGKF
jgi:hypothetical protein